MQLPELVALALAEDLGPGDLTTKACVDPKLRGLGTIVAKQDLVVSGLPAVREVFAQVADRRGASASVKHHVAQGDRILRGTLLTEIEAPLAVLLEGERLALNLLMKLSGIATHTRAYVEAARAKVTVVDTRKTTPLLRALEKAAVRHGGAKNHRFALYDGVMIKDNHIAAVGSIQRAVERTRASVHHLVKIEVEVTSFDELDEALSAGADVVLLDNMSEEQLGLAVRRARAQRPEVLIEASGNMDPDRIASIRDLGLDMVSAGGLIHQARWVDLSMKLLALPERA
ncbi:MAG: carboxylating nicotinate-nucleotide diphosphorylase [Deltaproteobacteria bacterium]|nr:MAG: carboxylating nicotinate-nucleotide diphosphorylase [Deltaproteobacteria bacterium]